MAAMPTGTTTDTTPSIQPEVLTLDDRRAELRNRFARAHSLTCATAPLIRWTKLDARGLDALEAALETFEYYVEDALDDLLSDVAAAFDD